MNKSVRLTKQNIIEDAVGCNFNLFKNDLESMGYKITSASEHSRSLGVAYFEADTSFIKLDYRWIKENNVYRQGPIVRAEDLSDIYKN